MVFIRWQSQRTNSRRVTRSKIARLNADGSLDAIFNPAVNVVAGSKVLSIAAQADGKMVIGGNFTSVGGVARNGVARLTADGTLDASFDPNANGTIEGLALQADGKS